MIFSIIDMEVLYVSLGWCFVTRRGRNWNFFGSVGDVSLVWFKTPWVSKWDHFRIKRFKCSTRRFQSVSRFIQIYIIWHPPKNAYMGPAPIPNVWQVRTSSRDGTLGTVLGQWKQSHWGLQAIQVASLAARTVKQSIGIHRERMPLKHGKDGKSGRIS